MNKSLEQVAEFHKLFNHRIGEEIDSEPLVTRQLRIKLLFEELKELAEASDCKRTFIELCDDSTLAALQNFGLDPIDQIEARKTTLDGFDIKDGDNVNNLEELDALCDLQYVLNGKILTGGYHKVFDAAFDQVQENNMTKAHRSEEHAKITLSKSDLVLSGNIEEKQGYYIVTNASGKIIKPWDHKKVSLEKFIK